MFAAGDDEERARVEGVGGGRDQQRVPTVEPSHPERPERLFELPKPVQTFLRTSKSEKVEKVENGEVQNVG